MEEVDFLNGSKVAGDFFINLKLISNKLPCWDCKENIIMDKGFFVKKYTGVSYYIDKIFDLKKRYICPACNRMIKLKKII